MHIPVSLERFDDAIDSDIGECEVVQLEDGMDYTVEERQKRRREGGDARGAVTTRTMRMRPIRGRL